MTSNSQHNAQVLQAFEPELARAIGEHEMAKALWMHAWPREKGSESVGRTCGQLDNRLPEQRSRTLLGVLWKLDQLLEAFHEDEEDMNHWQMRMYKSIVADVTRLAAAWVEENDPAPAVVPEAAE